MNETIEYRNILGNRKYKDSLFCRTFHKKKDLLDLYNALNGTNYTNPDDLEINTLDNALYIKVKNDVSCIIGCTMNLYEHQSSYNPNMPLRGMVYFSQLYNKYIETRKLNIFSSTLQKIPTPQYIVFYNGLKAELDRQVLKLSDAFQTDGGCLECEAVMLNINYGQNRELMERCRRLEEYALFVATVRKYAADKNMTLTEAITLAIDECIEKGILSDILTEQRAEVFMYILESFDKEIYERDLKAEAEAEGRAEGIAKGIAQGIAQGAQQKLKELVQRKLAKGKTVEEIAEWLEEDIELIKELKSELEE